MGIIEEFKKFAIKGNVVDLAVGVIIGGAFGKIVSSLVDNIIMPPIGLIVGGVDFSDLKVVIKAARGAEPEVAIGYGQFIQNVFTFLIIAWALFFFIKAMNRIAAQPKPPPATPEEILLLREIRDKLSK